MIGVGSGTREHRITLVTHTCRVVESEIEILVIQNHFIVIETVVEREDFHLIPESCGVNVHIEHIARPFIHSIILTSSIEVVKALVLPSLKVARAGINKRTIQERLIVNNQTKEPGVTILLILVHNSDVNLVTQVPRIATATIALIRTANECQNGRVVGHEVCV